MKKKIKKKKKEETGMVNKIENLLSERNKKKKMAKLLSVGISMNTALIAVEILYKQHFFAINFIRVDDIAPMNSFT